MKAGENNGKTLPQRNVVRSLKRLGEWRGETMTFATPGPGAGLRAVVLVQGKDGGPILAAFRI